MSDAAAPATPAYRTLRFETVDDALAELDRIAAADREGRLVATGSWTPGQVLAHVAAWIDYAYEGFPLGPPPFFIRWILRWQRKKILRGPMPRGVRIPRTEEGTFGMDQMPTQQAVERLRKAFARLVSDEPAPYPSPAFGDMSHEDRIRLNLRHAELHLGYLSY